MATTFSSENGVSNGTTDVVITNVIGSLAERVVKKITVYNADTVAATVTIKLVNGANERRLKVETLAAGGLLDLSGPYNMDTSGDSLELVLAGVVTTNELEWTTSYATRT